MTRLTEKTTPNPIHDCDYVAKVEEKGLLDKLGQIEDIEEELGIDIITLFKAFKNGIYSKKDGCLLNEPHLIEPTNLKLGFEYYAEECEHKANERATVITENALCLYEHIDEFPGYSVRLKDYGRTWALTKEELE